MINPGHSREGGNPIENSNPVTDHLDIWSSVYVKMSTTGRGSNGKVSPYGIQKLRELILELAVRGKLVPQDPNDEPASMLLVKIAEEKSRLVKKGKIKKQKALSNFADWQKQFRLPDGWEWVRLGDISADIHYGYTASANPQIDDVRLLRITDIQDDSVEWATVPGCEIDEGKVDGYRLEDGDILIARTGGTIGKSYLVENLNIISVFASYLIRVRHLNEISPTFVKVFLGSQLYWNQLYESSMGTGQPNVNGNALKNLAFALPSQAEQHRIVAKVDELMALCDQLEQQQTDSLQAHQTLVETLLRTLVDTSDDVQDAQVPHEAGKPEATGRSTQQAWNRIAEHFDTLFTTEASIDQLKQTILQLAVMGKLVPQDFNDEPASVLLEKIATEKAQLAKEEKIKKQKVLPAILNESEPFDLPSGWKWVELTQLMAVVTDGDHQAPPKADAGVPFLVIGNLNTGSVIFDGCKYVPVSYYEGLDWSRKPTNGDLLYTVTGSYGIPIVVAVVQQFCVQRHVAILKTTESSPTSYLSLVLGSVMAYDYASSIATGIAQKTVPLTGLRKLPVPVPPEKEQHRIVAKVNKLMALCDTLKARIQDTQNTQTQLADAVVEQAVA